MKRFSAASWALSIAAILPLANPSALTAQRAPERPKFRVEIHPAEKPPTCVVTNLGDRPVSAVVLEISNSAQPARKWKKVWDSLFQGHAAVEPGGSFPAYLYDFGMSPLPDKIEVIAAVWTDGKTFGPPATVNLILNPRAARARDYEDAAAILKQGLDQNWTREQYSQAFQGKPDNGAVFTVRTALTAAQQTGQTPQEFTHTMQFLLTNFQQLSKQLRAVKPL